MDTKINIDGQLQAFSDTNSGAWFKVKLDLSDPLVKQKFEALKLVVGENAKVELDFG